MIFVDSTPDFEATVFLIMFSKRGDRLTILDAPAELTQQLGMELRATFPRKITTDRATEDGLHVFEVRKGGYGCKHTFLSFSLLAPPRLSLFHSSATLPQHQHLAYCQVRS